MSMLPEKNALSLDGGREPARSSYFRHTFATQISRFAHTHDTFLLYDREAIDKQIA
jgi:hypothetical protein